MHKIPDPSPVTDLKVGEAVQLKVPENISKTCKDSHAWATYDHSTSGHNHNNITISAAGVVTGKGLMAFIIITYLCRITLAAQITYRLFIHKHYLNIYSAGFNDHFVS